jgi:hypothetical protein
MPMLHQKSKFSCIPIFLSVGLLTAWFHDFPTCIFLSHFCFKPITGLFWWKIEKKWWRKIGWVGSKKFRENSDWKLVKQVVSSSIVKELEWRIFSL